MATDLTHLAIDAPDAEDIANAVQDDLIEYLSQYPGTMSSPESVGHAGYDVVMKMFGFAEDD
jgi:antibiotic biosynthesis monooxygenase (ABM) superfamily enzyme